MFTNTIEINNENNAKSFFKQFEKAAHLISLFYKFSLNINVELPNFNKKTNLSTKELGVKANCSLLNYFKICKPDKCSLMNQLLMVLVFSFIVINFIWQ